MDGRRQDKGTGNGAPAGAGERLGEALTILERAATEPDQGRRVEIAREAVEVSRDCVEAWMMLSREAAKDFSGVREYLEEAVAAGDRLFADRREAWAGEYWQHPETRPYLQARAGFAQALWETGERERAAEVMRETLVLSPHDHQGVRYVLLKALLDLGRYSEAEDLVSEYAMEQSTVMLYGKLLASFAEHGDSLPARSAFLAARKHNPHVLDYLLGLRAMPQKLPQAADPGSEEEAIRYAAAFGDSWEAVGGIREFLKGQKRLRQMKDARKNG